MNDDELNSLTERIIGSAFKVLYALVPGFVEEVYHNALVHELTKGGAKAFCHRCTRIFTDKCKARFSRGLSSATAWETLSGSITRCEDAVEVRQAVSFAHLRPVLITHQLQCPFPS